ncbi:hypothetical protein ACI2K4_32750 [Micromonospora sp. NPDC050397]|uniref:hypothetical protein n=1 Tax=Micromonospora sp. NPDC050397 TaxID=3364279 RepID=UPI00384BD969
MSNVKWVSGAVVLVCTTALLGCQTGQSGQSGELSASAVPSASSSATLPPAAPTGSPSGSGTPGPSAATDPALSGEREVTIVRVQASEGGLSLDGRLGEADDDSGRQLFVPTPLGAGGYLIKAYTRPNNHPAADEPSCWQVRNPGDAQPLSVEAAVCAEADPDQRFTITAKGKGTYAISHESAFLQYSPTNGLILEELGDAPLRSTFRFVDNGPARRPAGG